MAHHSTRRSAGAEPQGYVRCYRQREYPEYLQVPLSTASVHGTLRVQVTDGGRELIPDGDAVLVGG